MIKFVFDRETETLWNVKRISLEDKEPNALPEGATLYTMDLELNSNNNEPYKNIGIKTIKNMPLVVLNGEKCVYYKTEPLTIAISEALSKNTYDFQSETIHCELYPIGLDTLKGTLYADLPF